MQVERSRNTGLLMVLYGANNLGKTTQAELVVDKLCKEGFPSQRIKWPIYDLEPTGPRLNRILREHSESLTTLQLQTLFAQNRRDFEPELNQILNSGMNVLAEDYKGTGIAWGLTNGCTLEELLEINKDIKDEDFGVLLDGERFTKGIEKGHLHEDGGRWEENRRIHLELAERFGWEVVNANGSIEEVNDRLMGVIHANIARRRK